MPSQRFAPTVVYHRVQVHESTRLLVTPPAAREHESLPVVGDLAWVGIAPDVVRAAAARLLAADPASAGEVYCSLPAEAKLALLVALVDAAADTDVAAKAGAEDVASGMGVAWADADRDGWPDLYVSNMFSSAGGRIAYQGAFGDGKTLQTDREAGVVHHREHVAHAFVFFPDEPSDGSVVFAVRHHTRRRAVDTEFVLDRYTTHVILFTD